MDKTDCTRAPRGFTLIELLITISLVTILLLIVSPSFTELIESNKQRTARDLLISALNTAQQQALSKNISVFLCPSSDGITCSTLWAGSTGWLVYEDLDRDGTLDTSEIIVSQINTDISTIANATPLIIFSPTGHVDNASTFTLCGHSTNQVSSQISITRMGTIEAAAGGLCGA